MPLAIGEFNSPSAIVAALDDFEEREFYPLTWPGMPAPGQDFVDHAMALGDREPIYDGKKATKKLLEAGPILSGLYRAALYDCNFSINVKLKGRTVSARFVPGSLWNRDADYGPVDADIMIIGKMPGVEEVRCGRQMVGPPGDLLARKLIEVGMPRDILPTIYVTSLVKCGQVDPSQSKLPASFVKDCAPILEEEFRIVKPKFVLCLGSEASTYLLGSAAGGVSGSYGNVLKHKVHIGKDYEGNDVFHEFAYMTCLHPSALTKGSADRMPELLSSLKQFKELVMGDLSLGEAVKPDHGVIWTEEHLASEIDFILEEHKQSGRSSQIIALDAEWHGEWMDCGLLRSGEVEGGRTVPESKGEPKGWLRTIQFSHKPGYARTIVLRHGGLRHPEGNDRVGLPAFMPSIDAAVQQLKKLLTSTENREVRVGGHHLKSDLPWLMMLDEELGQLALKGFLAPEHHSLSREHGGIDSLFAQHAYAETADGGLEMVAIANGVRRYDGPLEQAKKDLCEKIKIKPAQMEGYGELEDQDILPYASWDASATSTIIHNQLKPGGHLDKDAYGQSSWEPFWRSQRKLAAELEMEMTGLLIDMNRVELLMAAYEKARTELLSKLEELIGWPGFNPRSYFHVRTVLFGPDMARKIDKGTGGWADPRPEEAMGCKLLNLTPVISAGDRANPWERLVSRGQDHLYAPSTKKEILGILISRAKKVDDLEAVEILKHLRWYRFVDRALVSVLCPPDKDKGITFNEDGDIVYEKGLLSYLDWDGRVRTHFAPVDTGRVSSSRPATQNLSARREGDMKDILGSSYPCSLRSIIKSRPGYVFVEADFSGAELMAMAVQSGSVKMVDHCMRSALPESDPSHYEIHARVAKAAFGFECEPTKSSMKAAGILGLRDLAKILAFAMCYGRGDEGMLRGLEETGSSATMDDVERVKDALISSYPELMPFFEACGDRVLDPGYIVSGFGRRRRAQLTDPDKSAVSDMRRTFGNMTIQGGVADALSDGMFNLWSYPNRRLPDGTMRYHLASQIHDAVLSEVRIQDLEWYVDEVLPACLKEGVTLYACDLDGNRLQNRPGYHFNFEVKMSLNWGEEVSRAHGIKLGIPERFLPKEKKK